MKFHGRKPNLFAEDIAVMMELISDGIPREMVAMEFGLKNAEAVTDTLTHAKKRGMSAYPRR